MIELLESGLELLVCFVFSDDRFFRSFPTEDGMDGFFMARLTKTA